MKTSTFPLYRASLEDLLQDRSPATEALFRSAGWLFFSMIVLYVNEHYRHGQMELYEQGYMRFFPDKGRALEAYSDRDFFVFQFIQPAVKKNYGVQYGGRLHFVKSCKKFLPLDPRGTLFFADLEEARAFFHQIDLHAKLFQLEGGNRELLSKESRYDPTCQ